jgi:type I restriction enzyme S subunit
MCVMNNGQLNTGKEPLAVREAPANYRVMLESLHVRPGYKQTEVGVIPEDWDAIPIGSLGVFSKGQGIRKNEAASGDIPCVRYGEIYTYHNDIVRSFNSRISAQVALTSRRLKQGDLLFAGSGETKAEIGKCVAFVGDSEAYAGGDIVILSPNPNKVDSVFLGYLFNAPIVVRQKASKGQGDAVVHISSNTLATITIPFPPTKAEQEAIAAALSDVDALIASLDKLIAKKRDLKQAAMQQLLSGERRLPGFGVGARFIAPFIAPNSDGDAINPGAINRAPTDVPHGWEVKRLGDVLRVCHGKSQHDVAMREGAYPILATGGEIGRTNHYLYDKPSVLIGRKGTIDTPQYVETPFWTIDTLFYTEILSDASAKFIFYKFNMINWRSYNEASGVPSLNASTIAGIEIKLPKLAEQTAIASVLSDMDAEIASLETRRDKTRALKQGMMQELLTGRIRLV